MQDYPPPVSPDAPLPSPVVLPADVSKSLGPKFAPFLYYADHIRHVRPSSVKAKCEKPRVILVTSNGVYIANLNGSVLYACPFTAFTAVSRYKVAGVVIQATRPPDIYVKCSSTATAEDLFSVLQKVYLALHSARGGCVFRGCPGKEHQAQCKEAMQLAKPEGYVFPLFEDPRTGLPLVTVGSDNLTLFTPLIPKLLHFMGEVEECDKDWKGKWTTVPAMLWITPTCIFVGAQGGLSQDGREIRRCIAVEHLAELGICSSSRTMWFRTAEQPDCVLAISEDNQMALLRRLLQVLCAYRRPATPLNITYLQTADEVHRHCSPGTVRRPHLFLMHTREELHRMLSEPTDRKPSE